MCFHTSTTHKVSKLESHFKVQLSDESIRPYFDKPHYHLNGFAHPNMLVIPQEKAEVLAPGVWGIVPTSTKGTDIKNYYKEAVKFGGGLNAQSEKLFQHFIYKDAALTRRCIIPVSGFYEPHDHKSKKYPFYIKAKDELPLALAGIYNVIDTYITFTILTKPASALFENVHNLKKRQVIMLDAQQGNDWLSSELKMPEIKELIHSEFPASKLEAYSVSKDLFSPSVHSNVDSIISKVEYPELNDLYSEILKLTH
jgi:putative SOS response-associated peptidase YedK